MATKNDSADVSQYVLPILVALLVIAAFAIGMLWGKVQTYEKGGVAAGNNAQGNQAAAPQAPEVPKTSSASVDDDPVLGSADAPVTIIEFSDYECPFCKRHFEQTYPQLVENYIETGKVKLVYRDLPLSFHDPLATTEAIAANCARDQGGDEAYFQYHDELFARTESNGNGLTEEDLQTIAADLGLNTSNFNTCLENRESEDEVKADVAAANEAGATGTPSFIIGPSGSDTIEGDFIVGAQPFSAFEAAIESYLN